MSPDAVIAEREQLYRKFWHRPIAGKYRSAPDEGARVDVYAFRPTRKPWSPARDYFVYLTGGLSDTPAAGDSPLAGAPIPRIELSCYAVSALGFGDPQQDIVAKWLHVFAQIVAAENLCIKPGATFDIGEPLAPDSHMSAFYLGITPFVDHAALCRATINAEAVAHLIPVSEAERSLADRGGSAALEDAFRRAGVAPVFDLRRPSCV